MWDIRNKELHGIEVGFFGDLVEWAREYLALCYSAQIRPLQEYQEPEPGIWIPPDPDIIKVNVDAGFPSNSSSFCVGMAARNSQGVAVWWARKVILGRPQSTEGEATAVLFGVQMSRRQGWTRVIIETDCLPVYRALTQRDGGSLSFGAILEGCFDLISFFESISFSFVRRVRVM